MLFDSLRTSMADIFGHHKGPHAVGKSAGYSAISKPTGHCQPADISLEPHRHCTEPHCHNTTVSSKICLFSALAQSDQEALLWHISAVFTWFVPWGVGSLGGQWPAKDQPMGYF